MINLLEETIRAIREYNEKPENIEFIGSEEGDYSCSWDEFKALADREYDSVNGGQRVASDLVILFKSGKRMWRDEYDGTEDWECFEPIVVKDGAKPIKSLFAKGFGWESLSRIHREE